MTWKTLPTPTPRERSLDRDRTGQNLSIHESSAQRACFIRAIYSADNGNTGLFLALMHTYSVLLSYWLNPFALQETHLFLDQRIYSMIESIKIMSAQGKHRAWWPYKNAGKLKSETTKISVDEELGESMVVEILGESIQIGFCRNGSAGRETGGILTSWE